MVRPRESYSVSSQECQDVRELAYAPLILHGDGVEMRSPAQRDELQEPREIFEVHVLEAREMPPWFQRQTVQLEPLLPKESLRFHDGVDDPILDDCHARIVAQADSEYVQAESPRTHKYLNIITIAEDETAESRCARLIGVDRADQ